MKIVRHSTRIKIICSDHELEIFEIAVAQLKTGHLTSSGLRRSWARRTGGGPFLRIDTDKRTDQ